MHAEEWIARFGNRLRHIGTCKLRRELQRHKRQCTWCGGLVPKRRRTWCSVECVQAYLVRQPKYAKPIVFARDRGVCRVCAVDTMRVRSLLVRLRYQGGFAAQPVEWAETYKVYEGWLRQLGFHGSVGQLWRTDLYEVDHELPVASGGGLCTPANLATLCVPCHKEKTRKFNQEQARQKRRRTNKKEPKRKEG